MEPYVVRQGDYLTQLAHKFGFEEDAAWNDSANAELRNQRSNPNILFPSDLLYIPDRSANDVVWHALETGTTNTFVSPDPPKTSISITFVGIDLTAYASKAFTIAELPDLSGLSTHADGTATFDVPVTLREVTVVFTDSGESVVLAIGHLDPVETRSGVFQRLQNLGYIDRDATLDVDSCDHVSLLRSALQSLECDEGGASTASSESLASGDGGDSAASDSTEDDSIDAYVLGAGREDWDLDSDSPDSGDSAQASGGSADSSNGAQASSGAGSDSAGVADDGTLESEATKRLAAAFGC